MPDKTNRYDVAQNNESSVLQGRLRLPIFFLISFMLLFYSTIIKASEYYVNDPSTNLDVWCTSGGDNANNGLMPATPKATVQAVIDSYDLEPGDIVHIDTGNYTLTTDIEITETDQGSEVSPVIFEASPYGVTFYRGSTASMNSIFYLNNCDYVIIQTAISNIFPSEAQYFMRLTGSYYGVRLNNANHCVINKLEISANSDTGIDSINSNSIRYLNNIIYNNGHYGIRLYNASNNSMILNNTIVKNASHQFFLDTPFGVTVRNNIIWADGPGNYGLYYSATVNEKSSEYKDYNLLYTTNGACVGYYKGKQVSLFDWKNSTGNDFNSLYLNPKFVDPDSRDFHLKSTGGSYHNSNWTTDDLSSPGINTGNPLSEYSNEPDNNGARINLGAYGGTEQASRTPSGRELVFLNLFGGEILHDSYDIAWSPEGQGWEPGDVITIEYSDNNGTTWNLISDSVLAADGNYTWDTSSLSDSPYYKIRVTFNGDINVSEESDGWFYVHNGPIHYYVNDGSNTNDEWCTGAGDDANDGLTPASPKATVQSVLETYDLEQGDVVHIDTGTYNLASDIEIDESDQGSDSASVVFEASPYGVVMDRDSTDMDCSTFFLYNSDYITIRTVTSNKYPGLTQHHMKLINGYYGIREYEADFCMITRTEISSNVTGIIVDNSNNGTYSNNLIYDNYSYGIFMRSLLDKTTIVNNTIVKNGKSQISMGSGSNITFKNNIIWADGPDNYGVYQYSGSIEYADHNIFYATNGASIGYYNGNQNTLLEWLSATGHDLNSLSLNPNFVDIDNSDYHLKSTGGSYHNGAWSLDVASSPGLDIGDPLDNYNNEPDINGSRINLGAYGGTEQASKSPTGRELFLPVLNDDEIIHGIFNIRWLPTGQGWQAEDTVKIEYSNDNGLTWHTIENSVPVENEYFSWDTFPNSPYYKIRITSNAEISASTENVDWFYIHNGSINYYVNDASTDLDVWCTGTGDDANDGLTSSTPKASVQSIIDTYKLMQGDVVHIDTGNYSLVSDIEITEDDQGTETEPVTFEGSPYGVIFTHLSEGSVFHLNHSDYISILTATSVKYPSEAQYLMKLTGGYRGINLDEADYCKIEKLEITSNSNAGIYTDDSANVIYSNNLIHDNGYFGIYLIFSGNNIITNNTIAKNNTQISMGGSASRVIIKNNIIWVDGNGHYGIYRSYGTIEHSDYNLIYATNGANTGYYSGPLATFSEWQSTTGEGLNSFSLQPVFVDPDNENFHLSSTGGSYHNGVWNTDLQSSPGIDTGDPLDDYSSEPQDNGSRVNLGAYGGTETASKNPSDRELIFKTQYEGEILQGIFKITWLYWGQKWQSDDTVKIEYSNNNGTTWNIISESVPVEDGSYLWDTCSFPNSPFYKIRLTSNQDNNASTVSEGWFYVHNGPINYYVNDDSVNLDEWCTAVGNDENDGLTPATPKTTVQAILDIYKLMPGDVVHIDTGNYLLISNIEISETDQGAENAPVIFEASPYGVIIDRNSTSSGSYSFYLNKSNYVTICTATSSKYPDETHRYMKLTGGSYGLNLDDSDYCVIDNLEISSNSSSGIYAKDSLNVIYSNNLIHNNGTYGIYLYNNSDYSELVNNTIVKNGRDQIYLNYPLSIIIENNIIWADVSGYYAIKRDSPSPDETIAYSDYNLLYATNGAYIGYYGDTLIKLSDWQTKLGLDLNSLSLIPEFVDPENGDYHLKSTGGSYHNGSWSNDEENSPAIDTGDPANVYTNEPLDNGGRINLGAYGGTVQASKMPSGREIILTTLFGREIVNNVFEITWSVKGGGWQTDDTVKIEYTDDNGASWNIISESVPTHNESYLWDTTSLKDSPFYRLSISCNEETDLTVYSGDWFYIHNGPIYYYVNDSSTDLDEWCTGTGDDINDGLSPEKPKATVQAILDTYDLEAGDIVHIDTGNYILTTKIEVAEFDQGTDVAPVLFEASPYGVIFEHVSVVDTFYLNNSDYITIQTASSLKYPEKPQHYMKLTGGYRGIYMNNADYCNITRIEISSNTGDGISAIDSEHANYSNNLIYGNSKNGLFLYGDAGYNIVMNNTIVMNRRAQISTSYLQNVTFKNNIIWADGVLSYAMDLHSGNILYSDYNLVYITNEARFGYYYDTLEDWQTVQEYDSNSFSLEPGFVDTYNGDFHLMSTGGSYHDGLWSIDGENSPGIDSGDPLDDYSSEPMWNGYRINMGAYGGTEQASKTVKTDSDGDGIPDYIEDNSFTNSSDADTDNDGILDGVEDRNHNGIKDTGETNPCDSDSDNDGLSDGQEDINHNGIVDSGETNPLNADTDYDKMPDGWEVQNGLDPLVNDANEDADGDGYSNLKEYQRKTDPNDYNSQPSKGMPWLPLLLGDE